MNVGIIGGSDGLGKTLVYYLRDEFDVYITGRDHKKGKSVADSLNVNYIESNTDLANISDILIISVPIHHTSNVIREVAPFMKPGSLMMDVTSVKEEPSKTMEEVLPDHVEYIPTHPIFGPRTTELDNQVIVLTATKKGEWYDKVYNYFNDQHMRIIETTAQKHDYMMSIVQVLTHFSFISTASAIEKLKVDISETEDYESPIRNTFADAVIELRDVINNKDDEKFVEIAIKATKHMGDIKNALGRSDKAINGLNHEFTLLNKSIGSEVGLRHIYSGKIHVGILEKIENKTAILRKRNNIKRLRVANIEVLSEKELYDWKIINFDNKVESISCVFSKNVNIEIIENTVKNIANIIDITLTDKYNGPQISDDSISLTFEVVALSKEDIEKVKELFTGFGGVIR